MIVEKSNNNYIMTVNISDMAKDVGVPVKVLHDALTRESTLGRDYYGQVVNIDVLRKVGEKNIQEGHLRHLDINYVNFRLTSPYRVDASGSLISVHFQTFERIIDLKQNVDAGSVKLIPHLSVEEHIYASDDPDQPTPESKKEYYFFDQWKDIDSRKGRIYISLCGFDLMLVD